MNFVQNVRKTMKNYHSSQPYLVYVYPIVTAILISFLFYKGYMWYSYRKEEAAQLAFSQAMEQFNKAQQATTDMWTDVAAIFKMGYNEHSSSSLAPYFLTYQAQALLQQGKKAEALDVLQEVDRLIPASSVFAGVYKTKIALIKLDMSDTAVREQGVKELIALAQDTKNQSRDEALYYLGLYYWSIGNTTQARAEWLLLTELFTTKGQAASVYAQQAQARLDSI